jgi:hypothetical protein
MCRGMSILIFSPCTEIPHEIPRPNRPRQRRCNAEKIQNGTNANSWLPAWASRPGGNQKIEKQSWYRDGLSNHTRR